MAWEEFRVSVPTHFRCPISLDLMMDPVSLCTGMTYDRSSINRWLDAGHNTCPSTMQTLTDQTLTPNHTLRKLIHTWRTSKGVDHGAVPRQQQVLEKHQVDHLLQDARNGSINLVGLRKLKAKAKESSKYCRCIADSGAVPTLLSMLGSCDLDSSKETDACEAIVATLALIPADYATKRLIASPEYLASLSWVLSRGSIDAKINAAVLLESVAADRELKLAVGQTEGSLKGLVELLRERLNPMAVKASLRTLLSLCVTGRNRLRAVKAAAIAALVELLPDVASFSAEYTLAILEMLCKCAEGRAAFIEHALAISTVAHKICHVSDTASEYAVGILWGICKHCGEDIVLIRLEEAGVLDKLMLLLQLDFSSTTKHKMTEFLKLLKSISRHGCNLDQARHISMARLSSDKGVAKTLPHIGKQAKPSVALTP